MKNVIIIIYVLLFIVTISCSDDSINRNDETDLTGLYKAISFIEPGANDSGVDIFANNGILTIQFLGNNVASGQLFIPENIGSNYSPIDTNYKGTFTFRNDTLRFQNTNYVLDNPEIYLLHKNNRLETPDYQGRWSLFKIILEKQ